MQRILLYLLLPLSLHAQDIKFPLKASANKRYLVDQAGTPVFLNGCCAWRLPYAVTYNEARSFLINRKEKKFNAVLIQITPDMRSFKSNPDSLPYGANAFHNLDITQPDELYFRHVDSILELCNQLNFVVLVAPLYLGCCQDGWLEIIQRYPDGEKKCRQYGEWFANRYKHFPNLIWVSGGDHNPVPESLAFAEGIAAVDTTHLHTSHAHPGKSSAERFQGAKWHRLSSAYTYFPGMETDTAWQYKHIYAMLYEEMLNNYRMPCFLIESAYEKERHTTTQTIRRQAYWSLLGGATGEIFGHRDIYQLNKRLKEALNDPGSESMKIFHTFIQTIPWYSMKGDWAHSLFISGRGHFNSTKYPGGEDYATGAFTLDSSLAVLYLPSYRKVGVNMSRFKRSVTVTWFDPSSGIYKTVPGSFSNKGVSYFAPPSFNNAKGFDDWVLIIKTAGK